MSKPLVSIVIPVWNTSDNIRRMVSSILAQSFSDFELILVDDGSTDDTLSTLRAIEKVDSRIRVFTKPNGGPSSARNLGLEKASGTYIQFYDADDSIADNALSTITQAAVNASSSDVIVSGWRIDLETPKGMIKGYKQVSPSAETITKDINNYIVRSLGNSGALYNLWNKLFKTEIIREHNLQFREDLRFGEDLLFSLEYFKYIDGLSVIPEITYHYKSSGSAGVFSSSSLVPEYRAANDEVVIKFADNKNSPDLQWLRWRWLMSYWSLVAGSRKSLSEKISLITQFKPTDLVIVSSRGFKVLLMTAIAVLAKVTATSSLMFGWVMKTLKQLVVAMKSRLRGDKIAL